MKDQAETRSFGLKEQLRYRFDSLMARGVKGQFLLLAVMASIMLVVITISTIMLALAVGFDEFNLVHLAAKIFMLLLVPDPMFLDEEGPLLFVACVLSIFGGLFVGGTLIGILTTAIDNKMDELRRGRSFVAETGHTIILGWSSKIFRIVGELVIANETQPGQAIAILSLQDSVEMEESISKAIEDFRGTRLVCRSGNPISVSDLELVNLADADSIVILSPEDKADPDSHIIKILLTVAQQTTGRKSPLNVVVEVKKAANRRICEIIAAKANIYFVPLVPDIIVPRLLVQSCRKKQLSHVYLELFDFDGDEIYFRPLSQLKQLIGKSFHDVLFSFDTSCVIGLIKNGQVMLNPPLETICEENDEIIAITENDQTLVPSSNEAAHIDVSLIVEGTHEAAKASERNLVLGWTSHLFTVLTELEEYMTEGSRLTLVSGHLSAEQEVRKHCKNLEHYDIDFLVGDVGDREFLDTLQFENYDNILVLPDHSLRDLPADELDALTIKCLVHIRDIASIRGINIDITSQLLAKDSSDVASIAKLGDFVVSDEIVGRIIAQLAKNGRLKRVFDILLTPEDSEIYIKPIDKYVSLEKNMTFATVVESACRRRELAIGYISGDEVVVNVEKSQKLTFSAGDRVIVVAED